MGGVIPTSISGDEAIFQDTAFPFTPDSAKVMPEAIVRGAILVRINSLLRWVTWLVTFKGKFIGSGL